VSLGRVLTCASTCTTGLGKTTLAHVVAGLCGYRTVEINAR